MHNERRQRKGVSACTRDQAIDHACTDEEQRFDLVYRGLKVAEFPEGKFCFDGLKRVRQRAAREVAPLESLRAKADYEFSLRQRGQLIQCTNSPDGQGFCMVRKQVQSIQREFAQRSSFLARWNYREIGRA